MMKTMKTKILAVLAIGIILLNFAACGKADTVTTAAAQTTAAESTAATTETAATTAEATTAMAVQTQASTSQSTTAAPTTKAPETAAPTTKAPATKAPTTQAPPTTSKTKTFTAAELAQFDGKNGNNAYVAYNGIVYNVTGSTWKNGEHHGLLAGTDLTSTLNSCFYHSDSFFTTVWANKNYAEVGVFAG